MFLFMYRWIELRNLQVPFIWMVESCTISFKTSRKKITKVSGMTNVKKVVNLSDRFEDAVKCTSPGNKHNKRATRIKTIQYLSICSYVIGNYIY